MSEFDAVIIGGGPAGLTAALVLGRQRRRVLLVDADTPRNVNSTAVHMLPGREGIAPSELRSAAAAEVDALGTVVRVVGRVLEISPDKGRISFTLTVATDSEQTAVGAAGVVQARRILMATGVRDIVDDIPGLAEHFGRGVYHCPFCHGFEATGHSIAVIGGGYFGGTLAGYLRDRFSTDVVWFTQSDAGPSEEMGRFLDDVGVQCRSESVTEVSRVGTGMQVTTDQGVTGFGSVFHRGVTVQQSDLVAALGLDVTPEGSISVDGSQATSQPGVFAAGDCARLATAPGPSGFAATGSGDGQRAAVWLEQSLFREDRALPSMA